MSQFLINKEYESLVPPLPDDEYKSLKESIKKNGLWMPIIVNEKNQILDGHHRFKICKELGIKKLTIQITKFATKAEEIIFVGECNLKRRQLTTLQRIELVKKLEPHYAELALKRMKSGKKSDPKETFPEGGQVRDVLGKKADVSGRTYEKGTKVLEKASKKDIDAINKGDKTITKVYRQIRKEEKKKIRHKEIKKLQVKLPKTIQLYNMDFQKAPVKDNVVSLIFTDPPYLEEFLYLYKQLAKFAFRVLRDGGSLITYVPQAFIPEICGWMKEAGLKYHWPISVKHSGPSSTIWDKKVLVCGKIMLWFTKGKYQGEYVRDFIDSEYQGKGDHKWQQSTVESSYYIEFMTIKNEIICDPFFGSGKFIISAKQLNRQVIGCEIDKEHFETGRKLISNA